MARGKQFAQLVSDLRAELGRNNDPGVRAADLAQLQQTVSRVYEGLYLDYDWPHLRRVFPRIALSAGQRYYDFPTDMDFDRMERVVVWHNNLPLGIERGIDFEHYAEYDSEADARSDPVVRWDIRWVSTSEQIEVWPIPAGNAQELQFVGVKLYTELVDDSDLCLLDDNLVVLAAGIELETNKERKAAKVASFMRLNARLRGRAKAGSTTTRLGLSRPDPRYPRGAVIRISGA